jgi:hypothetical protein
VYFERLVIEAGDDTFSLDLHHRMTVIAGVGRLEREGLITELLGALGRGRSGVHLEIASDAGARYAIFRPAGARHRVVDTEAATDVTDQFTTGDRLDVLERAGLARSRARRQLCMQPEDLVTRSQVEEYVLALARIDQGRLWDVADRVEERERRLAETAQAAGSDAEDAVMFEEIERRHRAFELAQEAHERVRYLSFIVGAGSALVAICAAVLYGFWMAVPFLMLAIGATAASVVFWQRVEQARKDEEAALREAGSSSYLNFQINRVNGLLTSDAARRSMMRAAEEHRAALAEWRVLVGDIPVAWAAEHRREIRRQAAQIRRSMPNRNPMAITLTAEEESAAELAHALLQRLATLRTIGEGGESFPLLLDDVLAEVDPAMKPELLELLMKASADQQVIYLTQDEDVASWARVESLTGSMSVVEPVSERAEPAATPLRRRHGTIAV